MARSVVLGTCALLMGCVASSPAPTQPDPMIEEIKAEQDACLSDVLGRANAGTIAPCRGKYEVELCRYEAASRVQRHWRTRYVHNPYIDEGLDDLRRQNEQDLELATRRYELCRGDAPRARSLRPGAHARSAETGID